MLMKIVICSPQNWIDPFTTLVQYLNGPFRIQNILVETLIVTTFAVV